MILASVLCMGTLTIPQSVNAQAAVETIGTSVTDLSEYENNEILVKFKDNTTQRTADKVMSKLDAEEAEEVTDDCMVLRVDSKNELADTIEELNKSSDVEYVQPNYRYEISDSSVNDIYFSKQWALSNDGSLAYIDGTTKKKVQAVAGIDINAEKAWSLFKKKNTGTSVVVAVIDTGVDIDHPDLSAHIWSNTKEVAGDGIDNDKNGYIDDVNGWNFYDNNNKLCDYSDYYYKNKEFEDDHGTHCAGTIGAVTNNEIGISGIASSDNISIMSVKALGGIEGAAKAYGTTSSIAQAVQYAEKMGADICNMSFGGESRDTYLENIMKNSDMLFVCAAGNDGRDNKKYPIYPANYDLDNNISVANIGCDGNLAGSSDYGETTVDLAAPGTYIGSTTVKNSYKYETGTSMAAPMVTGVAALLYACNKNIDAASVKEIINRSVKKLDSLSGKVKTGGMLDAYEALSYPVTESMVAPSPSITSKLSKVSGSYKKKWSITITDSSGIVSAKYKRGIYTAADFRSTGFGTKLKNTTGTQTKTVASTGTFSVYAKNKYGKETMYYCTIKITAPTGVTLKKKTLSIKKGKTAVLSATVKPTGVNSKLTFISSNKKVASVTSTGSISAKKVGTAVITVTTENGKKSTCKVTVTK